MFSCGEEEITDAAGMSHRGSHLAPFLRKSSKQEEIWRHNLGAAASRDDTAEKKNKEEEEWAEVG